MAAVKDAIASVRRNWSEDRLLVISNAVGVVVVVYLTVAVVVGFADGDWSRPFSLTDGDPNDWEVLFRLGVTVFFFAIWAAVMMGVFVATMVIVWWVLDKMAPNRIKKRRLERREARRRLQAESDDPEGYEQWLLDHIRVDIVRTSNTEALLTVQQAVPSLPAHPV